MGNLKRMQEISEELLKFSEIFKNHKDGTYSVSGSTLRSIYDIDECEISIGKVDKAVEPHTHEETEHYLCIKGSLTVYVNGQKAKEMKTNDYYVTPPHTIHSLKTKGCELLVIRIPSSGLMND